MYVWPEQHTVHQVQSHHELVQLYHDVPTFILDTLHKKREALSSPHYPPDLPFFWEPWTRISQISLFCNTHLGSIIYSTSPSLVWPKLQQLILSELNSICHSFAHFPNWPRSCCQLRSYCQLLPYHPPFHQFWQYQHVEGANYQLQEVWWSTCSNRH